MSRVSSSQFNSILGWYKHRKVWHSICDCIINSSIFMKQHSSNCIKCWRRGKHQSSLKHLEFNIQKIFTMFWMEEFQEMILFIIINWFNRSGVWIWNWFIVRLNWKIWSGKINTAIINGNMIKSPHDIYNHRVGFVMGCPRFEVNFWRLDVTLY